GAISTDRVSAVSGNHIHIGTSRLVLRVVAARVDDNFLNGHRVEIVRPVLATAPAAGGVRVHPIPAGATVVRTTAMQGDTGRLLTLVAANVVDARRLADDTWHQRR